MPSVLGMTHFVTRAVRERDLADPQEAVLEPGIEALSRQLDRIESMLREIDRR